MDMFLDRRDLYLGLLLSIFKHEDKEIARYLPEIGINIEDCDINMLRASVLREDLDEVTRSFLPEALREFYAQSGYETTVEPDSLVAMIAFMARITENNTQDSLRIQHRFLSVHLVPTLRYAVNKCQGLSSLKIIVEEDFEVLRRFFI